VIALTRDATSLPRYLPSDVYLGVTRDSPLVYAGEGYSYDVQ